MVRPSLECNTASDCVSVNNDEYCFNINTLVLLARAIKASQLMSVSDVNVVKRETDTARNLGLPALKTPRKCHRSVGRPPRWVVSRPWEQGPFYIRRPSSLRGRGGHNLWQIHNICAHPASMSTLKSQGRRNIHTYRSVLTFHTQLPTQFRISLLLQSPS